MGGVCARDPPALQAAARQAGSRGSQEEPAVLAATAPRQSSSFRAQGAACVCARAPRDTHVPPAPACSYPRAAGPPGRPVHARAAGAEGRGAGQPRSLLLVAGRPEVRARGLSASLSRHTPCGGAETSAGAAARSPRWDIYMF